MIFLNNSFMQNSPNKWLLRIQAYAEQKRTSKQALSNVAVLEDTTTNYQAQYALLRANDGERLNTKAWQANSLAESVYRIICR